MASLLPFPEALRCSSATRAGRPATVSSPTAVPRAHQRRRCRHAPRAEAAGSSPSQPLGSGSSTWTEKEGWAREGEDVLFQLGAQSNSMRIDMGQRKGMIDELFTGNFLGVQADIASGELRKDELRTFSHLVGDYFVPPAFMDAVATHLVKNILADSQQAAGIAGSHRLRGVPLILGIWGKKGAGKSFNLELVCKRLGVTPIIVSAGELEDESAGQPGRRIRERYRAASQTIRNSGVMSALIINDLDAGCGRFKHTQVTVNNQVVMGTLMNLCDHPERASVGESWREDLTLRRVPIIITGNDLSTLYAPLLRDGRMAKFLWEPTREDIVGMLGALYKDDGLSRASVEALVDAFPEQPLDFFGALRARRYDATIREWVAQLGSEKEVNKRLLKGLRDEEDGVPTEGLPDFTATGTATLEMLLEAGRDLETEQETVLSMQLSREYQKNLAMEEGNGSGLTGFGGG